MSRKVAQALKMLDKKTSHIADDGNPGISTSDAEIARVTPPGTYVLTQNFDMVLDCLKAGTRFVWFDSRSRQPDLMETAHILLTQWDRWEAAVGPEVTCLKVGRRSIEVLDVADARRRAEHRNAKRMRRAAYYRKKQNNRDQYRLDLGD